MPFGRSWPGDVQLEYCEFCGVRVPAAKRIQATTQEYAGRWACAKCAPLLLNPSYLDYGGPGNLAPTPGEIEPHSGVDWITEIQGGSVPVVTFYPGATATATPDEEYHLNATQIYAIPFEIPRPNKSNTIVSVSLACTLGTPTYKFALYRQTGELTDPGELVQNLGTMTLSAGATSTVTTNVKLSGDAIYFFAYSGSDGIPARVRGFTYVNTNGLLGVDPAYGIDVTVLRAPYSWWSSTSGAPWPDNGGAVPWQRWIFDWPAFQITLDS